MVLPWRYNYGATGVHCIQIGSAVNIHGRSMDYIGDHAPSLRHESEFSERPSCGGRMHRSSSLCRKCHYEQAREVQPVDKDRRERFELALGAGWTVEELYGNGEKYDPDKAKDRLPSRQAIVNRMIENWFNTEQ